MSTKSEVERIFTLLVERSEKFHERLQVPQRKNCIKFLANEDYEKKKIIVEHSQDIRVIVHEKVKELIGDFIEYKRLFPRSDVENEFYHTVGVDEMIERMIVKRPICFLGGSDTHLLRDGSRGRASFDWIGTKEEEIGSKYVLSELMSYDEIQISSLLGASVPTFFINDGSRYNQAIPADAIRNPFESTGIYVGLVGARFERLKFMEDQLMHVIPYCKSELGFSSNEDDGPNESDEYVVLRKKLKIWARFYGINHFPSFQEALEVWKREENEGLKNSDPKKKFLGLGWADTPNSFLNLEVYRRRIAISAATLLQEAQDRAEKVGRKAYVHVVGLGLGVWMLGNARDQGSAYLCGFDIAIRHSQLPNVADIDFSWLPEECTNCGGVPDGGLALDAESHQIMVHFSRRNPAEKLEGEHQGKLLVASYAWDGNAYPGNEYWLQSLTASGDPAAACCSTISELQNPEINTESLTAEHVFVCRGGTDW